MKALYRKAAGITVILILVLFSIEAASIQGRVIGVTDGDSIKVLVGTQQLKIRLYGIDCPEMHQSFGHKAKKFTANMVFGKEVTLIPRDKDHYGRIVAEVMLDDGTSLSKELLKAGLAWWYRKYAPHDNELGALEAAAKNGKIGLWADPNPVAPWDFRRKKKK